MRLANVSGRLVILTADDRGVDVATASDGRFGPDPMSAYAAWDDFSEWASGLDLASADGQVEFDRSDLGAPVPRPGQVLAIGLNYRAHAIESGAQIPGRPVVFTKFVSSITGPDTEVVLSDGDVDWEVELVVVVGREARNVARADAWSYVAGLTVGNDVSDRARQFADPAGQWSMGKSFPGYGPTGPWLVTLDEVADPDDLRVVCEVDGAVVQDSRSSDLIFSVPELIEDLSAGLTLLPGDLIFTGTPSGVALGRPAKPYLKPGQQVRTWIEGIGDLHQTFIARP